MLSNNDIRRKLGHKIYIYPLKEDCIKEASVNLTASNMAWSVKTKDSVVNENTIVIPPHDTVLIETNEIIWVSNDIAGTYHSRVHNVSVGLGHVATTLDPEWIGRSLIAINNVSDTEVSIQVDDQFVTLIFYRLDSKSNATHSNPAARTDILHDYRLSLQERRIVFEDETNKNKDALRAKMVKSEEYRKIKKTVSKVGPTALKLIITGAIPAISCLLYVLIADATIKGIMYWMMVPGLALFFTQISQVINHLKGD